MSTKTETIAVCTMADLGMSITGEGAEPVCNAINEYLSVFAKPQGTGTDDGADGFVRGRSKCLKCGETLGGMLGSFRWGIGHGEGNCTGCGWPARAYHRPKDEKGEIFDRPLEVILQYHPDQIETTEAPDSEG